MHYAIMLTLQSVSGPFNSFATGNTLALDTLDHSISLREMEYCGITGTANQLFQKFSFWPETIRSLTMVHIWIGLWMFKYRCSPGLSSCPSVIFNLYTWFVQVNHYVWWLKIDDIYKLKFKFKHDSTLHLQLLYVFVPNSGLRTL